MIKTLLKSIREYKKQAIISFVAIVGEVIIECLIPFITADLIEKIQKSVEMNQLVKTGVIVVIMAVVSLCCGGLAAYASAKSSAGFAKNLRHDMFDRIEGFSFENIDRFSSASLVTRMTTDVSNTQMSFMMVIRTAVRAPLMLIFAVVMASIMGGKLALTFLVVIPVLLVGLIFVTRKAMPAFHRVFKRYDKLNESVEENVRAMRVVKGFAREDYEKKKFGDAAESIRADFTKAERIVAFNNPLMQACLYFNMVFVLLVGSRLVINGTAGIGVGQLSAMLTYGFQVLMSLMMLSMIYVIITISLESMRRISEVLNEESTLKNPANPVYTIEDGSIDFDNVSFKYSKSAKNDTLKDIDLHIKSGMTVGILGGTGSGKSTLVQLIPRLYDATQGSVRVGGRDVREYDIAALRDAVAMVLQKNQLFSGTIKDNLRWGNEQASDEELIEACKLAQAHEFVSSFPEGYDTYIEQGGTNVSGGQKQRLCIARALLKKPKILILDDSTSAVDTKTDALIRMGFKQYIPDTTKLIIAQRIASVQDADMIVILDNGQILSAGSHEELMKTSPIYKEIYEEQTTGRDDNE
ncbi:MAG: ABC transporter ATP-binding protein [Clostridia bacterium]|nr:ABC transporter ATP-binding protein [Clostridia bacterium]